MPLSSGTRLGPYAIVAPLGAGGMGEVYRARDTRLDRTVAIKVLPPHVLDDPGLRARFEREARAVSSLDHPNICVLYDVGREGGVEYLVMQHLEGETLADRLALGPLPLPAALRCAVEIAGALDAAHRAGILHRDIKPANVMLVKGAGREPSARLLDFGLAKSVAVVQTGDAGGGATVTSPLTGRGTIVGTLQYMSPEQLEGRDLDARTDIFSFGAVLYEMLTGRRAFDGGSQASIIGAILERDPPPIASLAPLTPASLDRLVRKCLAKDPERRWQSAADLCDELSWIAQAEPPLSSSSAIGAVPPAAAPRRRVIAGFAALVVAIVMLAAALVWALKRPLPVSTAKSAGVRRLAIELPDGIVASRGGLAISPDGRTIVFTGRAPDGAPQLYTRRFDSSAVTPVRGTQGARTPFFSPDGEWVGYLSPRALWKVSLRGGPPIRITGTPPVSRGAMWLPNGDIVLAPTQSSGLLRVSPDGTRSPLTAPDASQGERAHLWPELLPGGDILYTVLRGSTSDIDNSDIAVLRVATGERRVIYKGAGFPRYSPTGHLLFTRGGTVSSVRFDVQRLQTEGAPVPLVEGVAADAGGAYYAIAPDGALVLLEGTFPRDERTGAWVDRAGHVTPLPWISGRVPREPRISPDGTRALFEMPAPEGDNEVYLADLVRGTVARFTNDRRDDFDPIWTPDGRRIVWSAFPTGRLPFLLIQPADATGAAQPLLPPDEPAQFAGSVSRDNVLAYTRSTPTQNSDIWVLPLDGGGKARPLVATTAAEWGPEFSPDGRWIAFVSGESGLPEVYVIAYPGPGTTRRVTTGGGVSPAWSRDGRELFYQTDDALMSVSVNASATEITFGVPRKIFSPSFVVDAREDLPRAYDVSPDGKRFLMLQAHRPAIAPPAFRVLLNWTADLKQ